MSYSEAEKICTANNSSLVSIHYAEEQNFLTNFIFNKKKIVDNVWIGGKFVGNKLFQWEDQTPLTGSYSNWAVGSPKNHSDYCVQMNGDPDSVGKWVDEPCAKKNLAVCQRLPLPSIRLLAEALIALKHNLQQTTSELADTKKELIQNTKNLAETKKELLEKLNKESIPIGFIYVQLPKDKAPTELWPSMTWHDISADYEGVFFRVVGGNAASFGQVQQEGAPRLGTVHISDVAKDVINNHYVAPYNLTIPASDWSDGIRTGAKESSTFFYMNFKLTNTEVRPKNMAIKVFKRVA